MIQSISKDIIAEISTMANSDVPDPHGTLQIIASVVDLLDSVLDPDAVYYARRAEILKLDGRRGFCPELKSKLDKEDQVFQHKWVDKKTKGEYKSRCTCADVKAKYTKAQNDELDVNVPTPLPESHIYIEIFALLHDYPMVEADILQAFLIGVDAGAQNGKPVFMHPPKEWDLQEWLQDKDEGLKAYFHGYTTKDVVWRLDGNLYGRRTAGAVYRKELEEVI